MTKILSFSTKLKKTLLKIVNGHHNDTNCKKYQEFYERRHEKAPPTCKFKDHPKQIQSLLDKIVIGSNGEITHKFTSNAPKRGLKDLEPN